MVTYMYNLLKINHSICEAILDNLHEWDDKHLIMTLNGHYGKRVYIWLHEYIVKNHHPYVKEFGDNLTTEREIMVGLMGWGVTEQGWRKGPWTAEEDKLLSEYVTSHGEGRWSCVARSAGLRRTGKSCRLRWVNYLRPGLKRGQLTPQEESIIIELHAFWGNKWSTIARCLPGRTDNEIKNYWRTHFKKSSQKQGKKTRSRQQQKLMKKQAQPTQLQPQQQLLQQAEQLQQQQQLVDMKKLQLTLAEGQPPYKQETDCFFYPTLEDQCLPVMFQEGTCVDHTTIEEDSFWGTELWNLDDYVPTQFDQMCSNINNSYSYNNDHKIGLQSEFWP